MEKLIIFKKTTLKDALQRMDEVGRKLLVVAEDDGTFFSLLSIGDIQRAIIANKSLTIQVSNILRNKVHVAYENDDIEFIKQQMIMRRNEFMPIISKEGKIVKIILWEDLFDDKLPISQKKYNLPVIIMAGGEGRRLRPLTNVLPKPLLPLGEKTVIEHIIQRFLELGCSRFYLSLNYKAGFIQYYLDNLVQDDYSITYFKETQPLGTAGSLHLLKGKINETFFISNCDIIVDQDYSAILEYHKDNSNEITLVAALKSFTIPYGVLLSGENGLLHSIDEKPELTFKINTGLYILESHLLDEIPENQFYHITQLIQTIIERKGKIGVFPISENSWKDIGTWQEYLYSQESSLQITDSKLHQ